MNGPGIPQWAVGFGGHPWRKLPPPKKTFEDLVRDAQRVRETQPPIVEPLEDDRPSRERVERHVAALWQHGQAKRQEDKRG